MPRPASSSRSATASPATTSCSGTRSPTAERVDGGFAFTGTKIFTSLAAGLDPPRHLRQAERRARAPRTARASCTASCTRDAETPVAGVTTLDDWDTLGMRATQSNTTKLDDAVVADADVSRFLPVGPNADPFVFGIFANFLLLIGSVYAGIADRALELAVEAAHSAPASRTAGRRYAQDPDIRWRIADAALALDALRPDLEGLASDVDTLVDHGGDWFRYLTGAKHRATEAARYVVDQALRVAGRRRLPLVERARPPAARRARRHLPPERHRVDPLDRRRERLLGPLG